MRMKVKAKFGIFSKKIIPFKYKKFYKEFKDKEFTMLDVGCGVNSILKVKLLFSQCKYYGIDNNLSIIPKDYIDLMDGFYNIDLSQSNLSEVPDNFFDVVILTHVIEHLYNGLELLQLLTKKMKPGGRFFIETPGLRSLKLPSMEGTLNFCDDNTHVRIYTIQEIANTLLENNCSIIRAGTRRDIIKIILTPVYYFLYRFYNKNREGYEGAFWDILGFADYVYAVKKNDAR